MIIEEKKFENLQYRKEIEINNKKRADSFEST